MHDTFTVSCTNPACRARFSYKRSEIRQAPWDEASRPRFIQCPECGEEIPHKEHKGEYD